MRTLRKADGRHGDDAGLWHVLGHGAKGVKQALGDEVVRLDDEAFRQ